QRHNHEAENELTPHGSSSNEIRIKGQALRPLAAAFRVKPLAQLLAGLEEGHVFVLHEDRIPGARIASLSRRSVLHGESPEATQLDPVPARESARDLIEHDVDDPFNVAMEKMRIGGRHPLNQFRLDHDMPHGPVSPKGTSPLAPH